MTGTFGRAIGTAEEAWAPRIFLSRAVSGRRPVFPGERPPDIEGRLPRPTDRPPGFESVRSVQLPPNLGSDGQQNRANGLRAKEQGQRLLTSGESDLRSGNIERGVDLLEEALSLAVEADQYIKLIRLFIEFDCIGLAREASAKGRGSFSADEKLQNWSRLLAPPVARTVARRSVVTREDVECLEAKASEFRGKWVLIRDGKVVGAGHTVQEAIQDASSKGHVGRMLAHQVPA